MARILLSAVIGMFMLMLAPPALEGATYYVSPNGDDAATGTSGQTAWASISRINRVHFLPGDSILLKGGESYEGSLFFGPGKGGSAEAPIVISAYGKGKARISSGASFGFKAYNAAGFSISNLIFEGAGRLENTTSGIDIYLDLPDTRLEYLRIDSVEVWGYGLTGILFGSWNGGSGFDDVAITHVVVHDNGDGGISSYAEAVLGHRNVYIAYAKVFNNAGLPERTQHHSGNGIMLGGVDGALIEYCKAFNNGWLNAWSGGGPVGIWGYHCNNLLIQYNESHHNRSGTAKDGGGFDIDGGCTNCVIQYNYSHDNEGPGYLIAQYKNAPEMKGVIIRFNISENDARKGNYGAIHLWSSGSNGGIQNAEIYNNTVYVTPSAIGTPKALFVQSGGVKHVTIRNNIFLATGGPELVLVDKLTSLRFEGNNYWTAGSPFKISWGNNLYHSLEDWRMQTGQESSNGVSTGFSLDPQWIAAGEGVILGQPGMLQHLSAYQLTAGSALIDKGIDLFSAYGQNMGAADFWGNSLVGRMNFSIGAHQPTLGSKVCLEGGIIELVFAPKAGGSYSGSGVEGGAYFNPKAAGLGHHVLYYHYIDDGGQQQTATHAVSVVRATTTIWQGQQTGSNDWFDNNNWSSCVPTALVDVVIPQPRQNSRAVAQGMVPLVRSGFTARANSITNYGSKTIAIADHAVLEISGNYRGENVDTDPEASVIFRANKPQEIPAGYYGRLILQGKGAKRLAGPVVVNKAVVMGEAKLYLGEHDLIIDSAGVIENAFAESYIVTDSTGNLAYEAVGGEREAYFPVGTAASFLPAILSNSGKADRFSMRVAEGVKLAGTEGETLMQGAVNNTWHVEEQVKGGAEVALQLHWQSADELPQFERPQSYISHYEEGSWSKPDAQAGYAQVKNDEDHFNIWLQNITSFSPFAIINRVVTMPVSFLYFRASVQENAAFLSWATAAEKDNLGFYIEASDNGHTFHSIGYVASNSPHSDQPLYYQYQEAGNGQKGVRYYRLRQTDVNGAVSYSAVQTLAFDGMTTNALQLKTYPNPFQDQLTLEITLPLPGDMHLALHDSMGQLVFSKIDKIEAGFHELKLSPGNRLAPGIYLLTVRFRNNIEQLRVVKQ